MGSKRYSLNKADFASIGRGLLVALLGAFVTYAQTTVADIDFGAYTPLAVAINSVIVNAIRKFMADYGSR